MKAQGKHCMETHPEITNQNQILSFLNSAECCQSQPFLVAAELSHSGWKDYFTRIRAFGAVTKSSIDVHVKLLY